MKGSTARFIPYGLRPAKQAERRMLMDFLKCANNDGMTISDYRYVGMGGTLFYDFHLIHRFLGLKKMISLERDADLHPRSKFNCPYDFINVRNETAAEFMASDKNRAKTIYWLDYDDALHPDVLADIATLSTRLTLGGFAFVTVCAEPPAVLQKKNNQDRLEHIQQTMQVFADGLTANEMADSIFPNSVFKILTAAFKNGFAARTDGELQLLFNVQYSDSSKMMTVGGCFCKHSEAQELHRRVKGDLPFLFRQAPYRIKHMNLTDRERVLFDVAVTKRRAKSKQANVLQSLGFTDKDLEAYKDLIRFLPRYHESII